MVHVRGVKELNNGSRSIAPRGGGGRAVWIGENEICSSWTKIVEVCGVALVIGLCDSIVTSCGSVSGGARSQPGKLRCSCIIRVDYGATGTIGWITGLPWAGKNQYGRDLTIVPNLLDGIGSIRNIVNNTENLLWRLCVNVRK